MAAAVRSRRACSVLGNPASCTPRLRDSPQCVSSWRTCSDSSDASCASEEPPQVRRSAEARRSATGAAHEPVITCRPGAAMLLAPLSTSTGARHLAKGE